jgi:hypothetical protein
MTACSHQAPDLRSPHPSGEGRFIWTDGTSHEANRPAYHTRCGGSVLHIWVQDTFSPPRTIGMVIAVLDFENRVGVIPAYSQIIVGPPGPKAYPSLDAPDDTQDAAVVGRLRFDEVTDDFVAGRLSGRLVRSTRWDQADTSGTLVLEFRAPRRRGMEQYLCHGPRM